MSARSASRRKTRGRALPGWGRGVTEPISTNANPRSKRPSIASAFLSNPAASPIGDANSRPHRRTRSRAASSAPAWPGAVAIAASRGVSRADAAAIATACAVSASVTRRISGSPTWSSTLA